MLDLVRNPEDRFSRDEAHFFLLSLQCRLETDSQVLELEYSESLQDNLLQLSWQKLLSVGPLFSFVF